VSAEREAIVKLAPHVDFTLKTLLDLEPRGAEPRDALISFNWDTADVKHICRPGAGPLP
jgi:hypothetical protein